MKVLHLISGGDTGGAKTHIRTLLKGFKNSDELEEKVEAKLICFIEDDFYYDLKKEGIDIEIIPQKSRSDLSVVKKLAGLIREDGYDLVHCHGARANFIAMFLKRKISVPMVTTIHSDYRLDFTDNFYKRLIFTSLNKIALKSFKYYIAVTDAFKHKLVERGFKEDRVFSVYNGIDVNQKLDFLDRKDFLARYKIEDRGQILVGILARLDQVKDHETFIKAADRAILDGGDLEFLIGGSGPSLERLESLASVLGIKDRVHFLGQIDDPFSFLNALDINSLSSISESFPYAVLEGGLLKKPIVATNVGGLNHLVINTKTGYLVDVKDYEAMGDIFYNLSRDKQEIEAIGERLFDKIKKDFSQEAMARDHIIIYKKIIERERK